MKFLKSANVESEENLKIKISDHLMDKFYYQNYVDQTNVLE